MNIIPKNIPHTPSLDQETSINFYGEWSSPLAEKLQNSWFDAISMNHKLPDWIRFMEGASGKKYRYFINNFIESLDDVRYLEVGTWAGSTTCSALYGNKATAVCVDNWSEFGGPKDLFFANMDKIKSDFINFNFIEDDFNNIDYSAIGKFNVYLYDGDHSEQNQYNGVVKALPALDETFILVVDDWNWQRVRTGTWRAIEDNSLTVLNSIEIKTLQQEVWWAPDLNGPYSDWHNGYFISIITKS